jgi:predicted alpha/beta-fold hydrolase
VTPDPSFLPAPGLAGAHLQTIGARLLRPRAPVAATRERLELDDGDFVDLDWIEDGTVANAGDRPPLVLILHGMEGSSRSRYVLEMERALLRQGLTPVAMNFRSCSGEPNRLARFYHSGETGDLRTVLAVLTRRHPDRALGAVGFSLGGNVLLKHLGECGRSDSDPGIGAAAAISVPFDLAAGADRLERGPSRIYQRYLLGQLRRKVRAKAATLDGRVDVGALLRARTFRAFDDAGTAPLHGFSDAADYYHRSSSTRFVAEIRRPTLIVHSLDDPFLPWEAVPVATLEANPAIDAVLTEAGGHVGFVSGSLLRPVFWAEETAARYLAARLQ